MKICLAPMDGITDCAYRIICKQVFEQHGHPDDELMLWTEFMSADGYTHNPPGVIRHLYKTDYEPELIAQIFGGDPETLLQCAQDIEKKYNFAGIELNMGCPSPKVMKCEAGGGMMKDKKKTLEVIKSIAGNIDTPFSLKTRIGLTFDDVQEQFEFLLEASKYVWMITMHGRTYTQSHAGEVNRDFIYRLKEALPDKVINGNGGIRSYQEAVDHLRSPNGNVALDGIMIAQSAIGDPWILTPHLPTPEEKLNVIIRHLDLAMAEEILFHQAQKLMIDTKSDTIAMPTILELETLSTQLEDHSATSACRTPVEFRKFLFNYISGLRDAKKLKQKIITIRDYSALKNILVDYFKSL